MNVSKKYLQDLLMGMTVMEGQVCEILAQICKYRERFRAVIDEWEEEQQGQRDVREGRV